ncbi:hypothetical protein [Streptomyces niger]|uniref:hypothetical protein n=1 Tax=Streptomyces niger TaxID=66373 RepID=UPI000699F8FF|nr:hypothetical protein [Streptomyces niger]
MRFHGYHSEAWRILPVTLPSQAFTFDLVRQAIRRDAVIVLGRVATAWQVAVPELITHQRVVRPRSLRNAALSAGNFTSPDFQQITRALEGA